MRSPYYPKIQGLILLINTNEIPGKLSHKNMISSHVKITSYFHMWKDHHCYGYMINHALHSQKYFSEMVWHFIGVLINKTLHGHLEIQNFSSRVEKYLTHSLLCTAPKMIPTPKWSPFLFTLTPKWSPFNFRNGMIS